MIDGGREKLSNPRYGERRGNRRPSLREEGKGVLPNLIGRGGGGNFFPRAFYEEGVGTTATYPGLGRGRAGFITS